MYLKAVAVFSFLANDIEDRVNQFGTFGVVSLGPVVAGAALTENKVIWTEYATVRSRANRVHGAWLQVDKHGTRHVLST